MKEATGELNMTVVTIIAIAVVLAIFYALREPITDWIHDTFQRTAGRYEEAEQP